MKKKMDKSLPDLLERLVDLRPGSPWNEAISLMQGFAALGFGAPVREFSEDPDSSLQGAEFKQSLQIPADEEDVVASACSARDGAAPVGEVAALMI